MKRKFRTSVLRLAALAATSLLALAGCGGGAETEQSPVTSGPSAGPSYSGPVPATADIQAFRVSFWENVRTTDRCGNCHNAGGQMPNFARSDDVNAAYQQASTIVNRDSPSESTLVTKVGGGHNCWLADSSACASILTRWITDWVGATGTGGKKIELIAPQPKDPGASKRFPPSPTSEYTGVHTLLKQYCADCHRSDAATPQSPFFAAEDVTESYNAAIAKMNLDDPTKSRFVIRLGQESHNCWSNCASNAATMEAAIEVLAGSISVAPIDPALIVSKALNLTDGTVASGGNRYENNVIALYEFKTGDGAVAYDTSGVDPAADLTLNGTKLTDYEWVGGWGIMLKSKTAKAQASTASSRKFQQLIAATGEYSVEAWIIPGNVTQEDARIVSYTGGDDARNFSMGQSLYNYEFLNRSTATDAEGEPKLATRSADERLQASLQHVVMTFDPVNGRRIYVNGEFTGDVDPQGGGTLGEWDNSFAFVLGNEFSMESAWAGVYRMVAVHNRALTLPQIKQNFEAGVGQKYFMLFGIEHIVGVAKSYIMFEVSEYDSAGYLFNNPKFISLDGAAMPGSIAIKGIRIGVNGVEPQVGQAYRLLDTTIADANYSALTGQTLSTVGTIIGRENAPPAYDEFFLCFDQLGSRSNVCSNYSAGVTTTPADLPKASDIGIRTFDEINAAMAKVTGVSPNTAGVKETYTSIRQSLPATSDFQSFLASHQTSVAQLAIQYCNALVNDTTARAAYFAPFNFSTTLTAASSGQMVDALVNATVGTNVVTQPDAADVRTELTSLVGLLCPGAGCTAARTETVVKATCAAAVGSAITLIK